MMIHVIIIGFLRSSAVAW